MEKSFRTTNIENRSVGSGSPLLHFSRILPRKRVSSGRDGGNRKSLRPRSPVMPDDDDWENRRVKLRYFRRRNSGSPENNGSDRSKRKHIRSAILSGNSAMLLAAPDYGSNNNIESFQQQASGRHSIISNVLKCMSSLPTVEHLDQVASNNKADGVEKFRQEELMGTVCSCAMPLKVVYGGNGGGEGNDDGEGSSYHVSCPSSTNHISASGGECRPSGQAVNGCKARPKSKGTTMDKIAKVIMNTQPSTANSDLTAGAICCSPVMMGKNKSLRNRVWTSIKDKTTRLSCGQRTCNGSAAELFQSCGEQTNDDGTYFEKQEARMTRFASEPPPSVSSTDSPAKKDDENDFVTVQVKVHIKEGHGLVIRDASGSSDPYVKVKYRNKTYYKTNTVYRSLNPNWNEEIAFLIDDPTYQLQFEVYDFDRFMIDDFMGAAFIDLDRLRLFECHEFKLELHEEGNDEYMGYIHVAVTVRPLTQPQSDAFLAKAVRGIVAVVPKRPNKAASVWLSAVNVALIEARLQNASGSTGTPPDCFVKFKLGNEKYKSKVVTKSWEPKWSEQFDLHIYDENFQCLDVMIHDRASNSVVGRCSINLRDYERERTEQKWHQLDDGAGQLLLLLTISGTSASASIVDLHEYSSNRDQIVAKYGLSRSLQAIRDVGYLTVKVYGAEDLAAGDFNGKSDPFCVLELVNVRLQTHTVYKTLNPEWNKLFTFSVKDVHECLEITVYDEDPNKKFEFLGKVVIPLLKIRNCEKRWYPLRDRKLLTPVKGRILLEIDILWNPVKAALRTFKPRETKFMNPEQKFKRQLLIRRFNQLKELYHQAVGVGEFVQSCLSWQSYRKSLFSFVCAEAFVYLVETWHFPLMLLLLFAYRLATDSVSGRRAATTPIAVNRRPPSVAFAGGCSKLSEMRSVCSMDSNSAATTSDPCVGDEDADDDDFAADLSSSNNTTPMTNPQQHKQQQSKTTTSPTNDKSNTIKGRLQAVQDMLTVIQNSLDFLAQLVERVKNTFNFTVPFLSYLAMVVLLITPILLYLVPVRYIVMTWLVKKFSKRLFNPHYIDNDELLDFLSRVPSDDEYKRYYCEPNDAKSVLVGTGSVIKQPTVMVVSGSVATVAAVAATTASVGGGAVAASLPSNTNISNSINGNSIPIPEMSLRLRK